MRSDTSSRDARYKQTKLENVELRRKLKLAESQSHHFLSKAVEAENAWDCQKTMDAYEFERMTNLQKSQVTHVANIAKQSQEECQTAKDMANQYLGKAQEMCQKAEESELRAQRKEAELDSLRKQTQDFVRDTEARQGQLMKELREAQASEAQSKSTIESAIKLYENLKVEASSDTDKLALAEQYITELQKHLGGYQQQAIQAQNSAEALHGQATEVVAIYQRDAIHYQQKIQIMEAQEEATRKELIRAQAIVPADPQVQRDKQRIQDELAIATSEITKLKRELNQQRMEAENSIRSYKSAFEGQEPKLWIERSVNERMSNRLKHLKDEVAGKAAVIKQLNSELREIKSQRGTTPPPRASTTPGAVLGEPWPASTTHGTADSGREAPPPREQDKDERLVQDMEEEVERRLKEQGCLDEDEEDSSVDGSESSGDESSDPPTPFQPSRAASPERVAPTATKKEK